MKVYTKYEVKTKDGMLTGYCRWYMYDTETNYGILIQNIDHFCPTLPYTIYGVPKEICLGEGNVTISQLEFEQLYDKAINSLQNYIP